MTTPRLLGSRYEIGETLGYGGMAEVRRGRDVRLGREVAVKVLRADLARDPSFQARFRREAQAAASLNHPAIVAVYDTGEEDVYGSQPYIVMEYVEGRTLREVLKAEGRLMPRRAMEIVADVCAALDFSHRNGIIHRDIKPANVMITLAGAVKVMDFGIARAVADSSATVTQTANVIGTAQYLSPEQARGESVDARSDVYSTGCLLYELVTGVPPFQGDSPVAVAYQHVRENPVVPSARNPELPRVLDSIVMKSLAKNQQNRYQSTGEMEEDLQRALADQPVLAEAVMTDAERTQIIARTPPPPIPLQDGVPGDDDDHRRTGLIWAAVVVALLLVIGAAAYAIVFLGKDDNTTKTYPVDNVIGQSEQAARTTLAKHFQPVKGDATSGPCFGGATVQKNFVCTLEPNPGLQTKEGQVVRYHLFTPKLVPVPYVEGKSYGDALAMLNGKQLKVKRHNVNNKASQGTVLRQSIEPYTNVAPGTTVTLDVSTGVLKLVDVTNKTF